LTRGRGRFYKEGLTPLLNTHSINPEKGEERGACPEIETNPLGVRNVAKVLVD